MRRLDPLRNVSLVLAIIGAINWGLIGFFNWNLINAIFGGATHLDSNWFSRVIYCLVGLAGLALVALYGWFRGSIGERAAAHRRAEARI